MQARNDPTPTGRVAEARSVCGDGKTDFGEERLKLNRQIHLHLKLHSRRSPLSCISCRGSRAGCWRGGTQGGLNGLTHVLPRCLPTPTEEADGNGYGAIAGRGGPPRPPPRASVNLVPLLLTGVLLHPPGRTDKHLCRCFGAPATHARRPHGRVFPDHLIFFFFFYH